MKAQLLTEETGPGGLALTEIPDLTPGPGQLLVDIKSCGVCFPDLLISAGKYQIRPPLPFIPEDRHGEPFVAMVACWAGDPDAGEKALQPIRDVAPRVAEMVGPMPFPVLNSAFDALVPPGLHHYWKANFVNQVSFELLNQIKWTSGDLWKSVIMILIVGAVTGAIGSGIAVGRYLKV